MSPHSRVFITQQPRPNKQDWTPNFTPATRYGTLFYIFSASDRPSMDPDGAIFQAAEALEDFNPLCDYLLWPNSGDPGAVVAIMAVLARKQISKLTILNWERRLVRGTRDVRQGFYTPITFRLPEYK